MLLFCVFMHKPLSGIYAHLTPRVWCLRTLILAHPPSNEDGRFEFPVLIDEVAARRPPFVRYVFCQCKEYASNIFDGTADMKGDFVLIHSDTYLQCHPQGSFALSSGIAVNDWVCGNAQPFLA